MLCSEYPGIGALVEPECALALVEGIKRCIAMAAPNRIAIAYAKEFLDKERILARFVAGHAAPVVGEGIPGSGVTFSKFSDVQVSPISRVGPLHGSPLVAQGRASATAGMGIEK